MNQDEAQKKSLQAQETLFEPLCSICGITGQKNPNLMCMSCVRRAIMDLRLRWEKNTGK